jgi:thiamine pyrophosphokinase
LLAVIFANGELNPPSDLPRRLAASGLILAADGGAQHCRALGVRPHAVIGDLDSLGAAQRAELEAEGAQIISHPADKDQTDLELALLYAAQAGANGIQVLAGLGRRWDHSIANLLLAAQGQFSSLHILFLDGEQRLFVIRNAANLEAKLGERVSLLPLGGDAQGVSTRGLKYPLNAETLAFGSSRGVSNVVVDGDADVKLTTGRLLCVISPGTMD